MHYHAPSGGFIVSPEALRFAASNAEYALRNIRLAAGLPLTPYSRGGSLDHADHAQRGLLAALKHLGVDMGSEWGHELDLSKE